MLSLFDCFKTAEASASEFLVADEALQEVRVDVSLRKSLSGGAGATSENDGCPVGSPIREVLLLDDLKRSDDVSQGEGG